MWECNMSLSSKGPVAGENLFEYVEMQSVELLLSRLYHKDYVQGKSSSNKK